MKKYVSGVVLAMLALLRGILRFIVQRSADGYVNLKMQQKRPEPWLHLAARVHLQRVHDQLAHHECDGNYDSELNDWGNVKIAQVSAVDSPMRQPDPTADCRLPTNACRPSTSD